MEQGQQFDILLERMPAIAEAVNRFESREVQQAAFGALIAAAGGSTTPQAVQASRQVESEDAKRGRKTSAKKPKGLGGGKKSKGALTQIDKDLDLRPAGKQSFVEFAGEKEPKNNYEKSIVSVYWLARIAEHESVGLKQVLTCYRTIPWKVPADLANQLQSTAATKGWLDTSNMEDIKLTVSGEQYVEIDLATKPKS